VRFVRETPSSARFAVSIELQTPQELPQRPGGSPMAPERRKAAPLTVYRRVEEWLRQNPGKCVCDGCIANELAGVARANISNATNRLGTCETGFSKYRAKCECCGSAAMVTRASPDLI
jgi:hypothetical protein